MILTFILNWFFKRLMKDLTSIKASDLNFLRYIHKNIAWLSNTVRKYLCPKIDGIEKGSKMSIWVVSKQFLDAVMLLEKGKRLSLE